MSRTLLILTDRLDLTADYLITILREQGRSYFRLNADQIQDIGIELEVRSDGVRGDIFTGRRSLSLSDVCAIWYRRAQAPILDDRIDPSMKSFTEGELRHLIEGLVLGSGARWVNGLSETQRAERKLYQLSVATEVGFEVPRTLVTKNAEAVRAFASTCRAGIVCKPIFHGLWRTRDADYAIYTRDVDPEVLPQQAQLDLCPALLQERVLKHSDARVTVVGSDIFAAETLYVDGDVTDWRRKGTNAVFRRCNVPADISERCRDLMSVLALSFGAFDFIRTMDDRWVFLEINPTGEWVWLERELQLPISNALINHFFAGGTAMASSDELPAFLPKRPAFSSSAFRRSFKTTVHLVRHTFTPYESGPGVPGVSRTEPVGHIEEKHLVHCEKMYEQQIDHRKILEQKAASLLSLQAVLAPLVVSALWFVRSEAVVDGRWAAILMVGISTALALIVAAFVAAFRANAVKGFEALGIGALLEDDGKTVRSYSEDFRARGLLYCALRNTVWNDHVADFVRASEGFLVAAIVVLLLCGVPILKQASATKSDGATKQVSAVDLVGPLGEIRAAIGRLSVDRDGLEILQRDLRALSTRSDSIDAELNWLRSELVDRSSKGSVAVAADSPRLGLRLRSIRAPLPAQSKALDYSCRRCGSLGLLLGGIPLKPVEHTQAPQEPDAIRPRFVRDVVVNKLHVEVFMNRIQEITKGSQGLIHVLDLDVEEQLRARFSQQQTRIVMGESLSAVTNESARRSGESGRVSLRGSLGRLRGCYWPATLTGRADRH